MIPESFINDLQERTDIVEVISSYIPLKRTGRNFKALCPFHNEKTPSFIVSPQKQIFHCFGCGEGGSVIQFLMLYEKVNFVEAIEILAKRLGMEVPYQKTSGKDRLKTVLLEIVSSAAEFYHQCLINKKDKYAESVLAYLDKRGITLDIIRLFKIGYAPYGNVLINYLRDRNISLDFLEKASLATALRDGGYVDFFRNRIIIPIFDVRGRVVGFGGRVWNDEAKGAKYINSVENSIYNKREHLYGLNFAKEYIIKEDCAIIVEGYLDMIIPFFYGVKNIVASLGTALTTEQIRLIKRYTENIVLVYDSDKAGQMATLRALDLLLENSLKVSIMLLPPGSDPDSIVRERGVEFFNDLLAKRVNFFDYKLKILSSFYNPNTTEGRVKIMQEMLDTLRRLDNELERYDYIGRLADFLRVKKDILIKEFRKISRGRKQGMSLDNIELKEYIPMTEKIIIKFMLTDERAVEIIRTHLIEDDFSHPLTRKIVSLCFTMLKNKSRVNLQKIIGLTEDREISSFITMLMMDDSIILDKDVVKECILKFKENRLKLMRNRLREKIKIAESKDDREELKRLVVKYQELTRSIKIK